MTFEVLDPTHEEATPHFALAPRVTTLDGATVGIVSNGKQGTRPFFDALADELRSTYRVAHVDRVVKSNYSAPFEAELNDRVRRWNALVSGIGD